MRFSGKINSWNAERSFGFIRPADGGQDIFVHMSALTGGEPRPDELLSFEVALNREGKKKAINVRREAAAAVGPARPAPQRGLALRMDRPPSGSGWMARVLVLALLVGLGWAGFNRYAEFRGQAQAGVTTPFAAPARPGLFSDIVKAQPTPSSRYSCDGRMRCSQMTSCEEATFFLKNCPGTKMDGNHDGVPCEMQWCR